MAVTDDIGSRGEILFCTLITNSCGRSRPYLWPRFLGEKTQTLDYLVELRDAMGGVPGHFFVQVKTTQQGYTRKRPRHLKVGMSAAEVRRCSLVPAPTYLVGIDEPAEVGYIVAILAGMTETISSLPTDFPLDCTNIPRLYQEVEEFWATHDMTRRHSVFSL